MKEQNREAKSLFDSGQITYIQYIVKLFQNFLRAVVDTSVGNILKVFVVLVFSLLFTFTAWTAYRILSSQESLDRIIQAIRDDREADRKGMEMRDLINPKINHELEKMVYSSQADRVIIYEYHNGKSNPSGLPFRFMDATYESVNSTKDVKYISDNLANIPVSHYVLPYTLGEQKYFYGNLEAVKNLDERYAQFMESNGAKYICGVRLIVNGHYIGWLAFLWSQEIPDSVEQKNIKNNLDRSALIIQNLLDCALPDSTQQNNDKN